MSEDAITNCPLCEAPVDLSEDPVEGELLECAECGSELEILSLAPVTLGEAPETEEDWGE